MLYHNLVRIMLVHVAELVCFDRSTLHHWIMLDIVCFSIVSVVQATKTIKMDTL